MLVIRNEKRFVCERYSIIKIPVAFIIIMMIISITIVPVILYAITFDLIMEFIQFISGYETKSDLPNIMETFSKWFNWIGRGFKKMIIV